jgi:hypothetical protein
LIPNWHTNPGRTRKTRQSSQNPIEVSSWTYTKKYIVSRNPKRWKGNIERNTQNLPRNEQHPWGPNQVVAVFWRFQPCLFLHQDCWGWIPQSCPR